MPALAPTRKLAQKILNELQPFCDLIEIAGSIRRGRSWVNDIDLVALPKPGQEADFRARCKRNAHVMREGPQMMELRLENGLQVDLWIAHQERREIFETTPTNFGSLLICRTGSKEHNMFLVEEAKKLDLKWNPHHGVFKGNQLIASATELDIFQALNLPFIKPEERER